MKNTKETKDIQNIYDNPDFFESYKQLRQNDLGFNNLIEQPIIRSLLPNLHGKVVLDIGCGFGDFCRYAAAQGASKIKGIDPSENMIAEAKQNTLEKTMEYECIPVELYRPEKNQFDVIVSSVALHYVKDLPFIVK